MESKEIEKVRRKADEKKGRKEMEGRKWKEGNGSK
jgi:hypothetical protein